MDYTENLGELNFQTVKYIKISRKKVKPIEPDSNFKSGWDFAGLLLLIYESMIIPYRVAFNVPSSGLFMLFEGLIDLFFIFDICKT